jgi:hypothetical protein
VTPNGQGTAGARTGHGNAVSALDSKDASQGRETSARTPQAPGRTPHKAPQASLRCPGAEDTPPETSGAPAREAKLKVQQHAMVAEGVGLDPVEVKELGDALVIGAEQLGVDLVRDGGPVDLGETMPREEPGGERQHEHP